MEYQSNGPERNLFLLPFILFLGAMRIYGWDLLGSLHPSLAELALRRGSLHRALGSAVLTRQACESTLAPAAGCAGCERLPRPEGLGCEAEVGVSAGHEDSLCVQGRLYTALHRNT